MHLRFMKAFVAIVWMSARLGWADEQTELIQQLEAKFSTIKTVQANFVQEKTLKVFNRTIELKGRLTLENPSKLAWRIDTPIKYVLVLNENYALQWDEDSNKVEKMKTAGDPMFEEVLGQIERWFAGRFSELTEQYDMSIESRTPLKMCFVPKEGNLTGKAIRRVRVQVRADFQYVEKIEIEDVSGDFMSIRFLDTRLNEKVPISEWKVVPANE